LSHAVKGTAEYEELTGRLVKDAALDYEHTLSLAQRRADVEAQIHQLAIDQNREFSRSFFGSGPADMLRKLAAFKLALGGPISQGQMYSMGPAMRQDVGNLTGMNPEMAQLQRERNRLSANGFASGGYTGDGNPSEIAGVVHKGEYVLSHEDLFHQAHSNLFPSGHRFSMGGGGIYQSGGVPMEHNFGQGQMRIPTQERWLGGWRPGDAGRQAAAGQRAAAGWATAQERMSRDVWWPGRGTPASPWSPRGTSFGQAVENIGQHGWTAARGFMSNPATWANIGKNIGTMGIGAGVTGGLNWAGGKVGLNQHDTYGGTAFGLFSDAAGGAVMGARGGAMGAAIGAVSGMVLGDAGRAYGDLRDIHKNTIGAGAMHKQVEAHQQALLQRQRENPHMGGDFERQMATRREAASQSHAAFDARMAALDERNAASEARQAATEKRYGPKPGHRESEIIRGHTLSPHEVGRMVGRAGVTIPNTHPAHPAHAAHAAAHPAAPNNAAMMPVARPAASGGGSASAAANGGDDAAIKNATAALDLLTTTAGKLNTAFAALAARADSMFKGGGNGLQFAPTGQMGGSYPGKH
jgi:hypothetical protein